MVCRWENCSSGEADAAHHDQMCKSGYRAICFSQVCCNPITHFPSIMPPVRRIPFGPVRRLSFESRSRSSAICIVCFKVFPRTARQWDSNRDMCRLCAMVQAEEAGHRQARLVAVEEEEKQHVQQGFTIRIPPRIHRICVCEVDDLHNIDSFLGVLSILCNGLEHAVSQRFSSNNSTATLQSSQLQTFKQCWKEIPKSYPK
jgi:hypothetical protein